MPAPARNRATLLALVGIALGMGMLAFASAPLYRVFCSVTGFGGTPREASVAPEHISGRTITVSFNTDTDPALPWKFTPPKPVKVHIGENTLVAFHAVNESGEATRGRATYNVTPYLAGPYFDKIQCFCFREQQLAPHASADLPVSFFHRPRRSSGTKTSPN
ncbi:MAG: cytochrome c oxidase assembly protein [Alphaproteobacteria bacterium]